MHQASPSERRREAALAGHRGDAETARDLLDDPDPSVRGTALAALERCATLGPDQLGHALQDPDAAVRRRAAEIAARHPEVSLWAALHDADPLVVEMAAWASGERFDDVELARVVQRLVELTTSHRDPLVREAAVAAIGSLFAELPDEQADADPAARQAVLTAMTDKAAVRRRAVLALSAFDGPDIDVAMRAARSDRDWQVRDAATELLGLGEDADRSG